MTQVRHGRQYSNALNITGRAHALIPCGPRWNTPTEGMMWCLHDYVDYLIFIISLPDKRYSSNTTQKQCNSNMYNQILDILSLIITRNGTVNISWYKICKLLYQIQQPCRFTSGHFLKDLPGECSCSLAKHFTAWKMLQVSFSARY